MTVLLVLIGGMIGAPARYLTDRFVQVRHDSVFPWGTFVVNVTGSFALGALVVLAFDRWPRSRYLRPFLGVGVLGGFTTFSTYVLDVRTLVADERMGLAAVYLVATLLVGLAAAWLGMVAARWVDNR